MHGKWATAKRREPNRVVCVHTHRSSRWMLMRMLGLHCPQASCRYRQIVTSELLAPLFAREARHSAIWAIKSRDDLCSIQEFYDAQGTEQLADQHLECLPNRPLGERLCQVNFQRTVSSRFAWRDSLQEKARQLARWSQVKPEGKWKHSTWNLQLEGK